jgi:hypothetical protein
LKPEDRQWHRSGRVSKSPQDPQSIRKIRLGPLRNVCKDKGSLFPKSRQQIPQKPTWCPSCRRTIKSQRQKATSTSEGCLCRCHEPTVPSVTAPRSINACACEAYSQSPLLHDGVLTCFESTAHKSPLIGNPARSHQSATVAHQPTFNRKRSWNQRRR